MKYKDWLYKWLELYVKPICKERTHKKYKRQIERYIIPILGEIHLKNLTANRLQCFSVELTQKELSASTVNGIISIVKSSLKRAVFNGITKEEYTCGIVRPKRREKKIESFTKEEQKSIELYIIDNHDPSLIGILICLYTGLRIGELLALKWEDLDLKKKVLSVNKTCYDSWVDGKYQKVIEYPKTENSVRIIPIPTKLLPKMKETQKISQSKYVVCVDKDYGVQVRSYQRKFELILKKIGVMHKGFHSLRHTFATRAIECGMDVRTLSEILGHKDPTVTLRRYAHSMMDHKTEMINRVGKLMI